MKRLITTAAMAIALMSTAALADTTDIDDLLDRASRPPAPPSVLVHTGRQAYWAFTLCQLARYESKAKVAMKDAKPYWTEHRKHVERRTKYGPAFNDEETQTIEEAVSSAERCANHIINNGWAD